MLNRPTLPDLETEMLSWNADELSAFFCCVRSSPRVLAPAERDELIVSSVAELFWAYNSRTIAEGKRKLDEGKSVAYDILPDALKNRIAKPGRPGELHEYAKSLTCEFLLREACSELRIENAHCESSHLLEIYFFETIIARMVVAMKARERHEFLTRQVQLDAMASAFPGARVGGPLATLAALSAAQASGFGVYLGATTALGFASHAVGVTLPFAAYAGMTSTIAFVIGPLGFLASTGWLAHVLTSPEWARMMRGLLHIIAMRAKYSKFSNQLASNSMLQTST